jgi:hypothetical protein
MSEKSIFTNFCSCVKTAGPVNVATPANELVCAASWLGELPSRRNWKYACAGSGLSPRLVTSYAVSIW